METINACIGIGDLLIYSSILIEANLIETTALKLSREILVSHRENSKDYKHFIETLLTHLGLKYQWASVTAFQLDSSHQLMQKYQIATIDHSRQVLIRKLGIDSDQFKLPDQIANRKYLVIHTKCREFYDFDGIRQFCQLLKTRLPIVLLGEKRISPNFENTYCKTQSLHQLLLETLSLHNEIIDLTFDDNHDIQSHPQFESFQRDINIIAQAESNLVFGQGGNYVMVCFFAKKFMACNGHLSTHQIKNCCPHGHFYLTTVDMMADVAKLNEI